MPENKPIQFQPAQPNDIHFLDVSNDGLTMKSDQKEILFWTDIEQRARQLTEDLANQQRDEF